MSKDKIKYDLEGSDEKKEIEKVDYKAVAEEFQRRIYTLEKIIRSNGLDSELPNPISDEEFICLKGIETVKMLVFNQIHTKDDINMFDILYRNLNTIRGIKGSNQKKEKPKTHAELLQLVKKQ